MKYKIDKLRKLDWKLRILICIAASIMGIVFTQLLFNNIEYKVKNYDYKKIHSVNGVVTKAYFKNDYISSWPLFNYDTSAYIDVKLETGKTITIELESGKSPYSKGDNISIYTNDTNYSFTKRGVARDSQNTVVNLLLISFNWIFVIAVWSILFKLKGLTIGLLILIFYLLW